MKSHTQYAAFIPPLRDVQFETGVFYRYRNGVWIERCLTGTLAQELSYDIRDWMGVGEGVIVETGDGMHWFYIPGQEAPPVRLSRYIRLGRRNGITQLIIPRSNAE